MDYQGGGYERVEYVPYGESKIKKHAAGGKGSYYRGWILERRERQVYARKCKEIDIPMRRLILQMPSSPQ